MNEKTDREIIKTARDALQRALDEIDGEPRPTVRRILDTLRGMDLTDSEGSRLIELVRSRTNGRAKA